MLGKAKIRKWLETQETFVLHRQINRKFRRRKVIAPFIDYQWDADTAVMKSFVKVNQGYAYFILAIDVFSRFVHTFPLRSTRGQETAPALGTFFRTGRKPVKLRTDKGTEYRNRDVERLLKREKCGPLLYPKRTEEFIHRASHQDDQIKTQPLHVPSSDASLDRRLGFRDTELQRKLSSFHQDDPTRINEERRSPIVETTVETRKKTNPRFAFKKGDTVLISHVRQPFDREYDERWTVEYFVVTDRGVKEGLPYYTLKDTTGEVVQGTFSQSELNRVKVTEQTVYRIEKVLRRRRNEAMVKWM